jgi:hypothetical protein
VVVSTEEIQSMVTDILKENMEAIVEQRYHINGLFSASFSFYFVILLQLVEVEFDFVYLWNDIFHVVKVIQIFSDYLNDIKNKEIFPE